MYDRPFVVSVPSHHRGPTAIGSGSVPPVDEHRRSRRVPIQAQLRENAPGSAQICSVREEVVMVSIPMHSARMTAPLPAWVSNKVIPSRVGVDEYLPSRHGIRIA